MKKTISKEQAREIMLNDDSESFPYRVLTEAGKLHLAQFVLTNAAQPDHQNLDAWYSEAEQRDAGIDENVDVEMPGHMSATGNPVLCSFDDTHFEWRIND